MFTYINSKFIKTSVSKKTLTDNSETTVVELLPTFPESTKPICRIYSRDIDCSADFLDSTLLIKNVPAVCTNSMNDTYNSVNTTFDYDVGSDDMFYIVAIPFNGMITDIKFSDGIKVVNGFFIKHQIEVDDAITNMEDETSKIDNKKFRFSKIAYFVFRKVDIEYSGLHNVTMSTSSVSFDKTSNNPNDRIKSFYTNVFTFGDSVVSDATLISSSKRDSVEPVIDDVNHNVPAFISLFVDQIQIDKHYTPKPKNKNYGNGRRNSYNEKRIPNNDKFSENFFTDTNSKNRESRANKKAINRLNENKKKYFEE